MRSWKTVLLYGVLVWLVPFAVSFLVFPLRAGSYALFESIMVLAITAAAVFFGARYLGGMAEGAFAESVKAGLAWLVVSLAIDAPLFLFGGPMYMPASQYAQQIGLKYLAMPIITAGFGYVLETRAKK